MNRLLIAVIIGNLILKVCGIHISFITWNVNDNKRFSTYTKEVVLKLLNIQNTNSMPDLYAITFQENCIDCGESRLEKLSLPFINVLKSTTGAVYEFVSISATRETNMCESVYCLSTGSMHGTTFMLILIKAPLQVSNVFQETINSGSDSFFSNKEKGITVVGLDLNNEKLCFGGLHLDVGNIKYRQKVFNQILNKLAFKCDVMFFGGDFNTRPNSKSHPVPSYFDEGKNETYLNEMKVTDELSGSQPFSGGVNLLTYIAQKMGKQFVEPFNKSPNFKPTYSIEASLNCDEFPVCYESDRFPSWTDRIIYWPASKVQCSEYSIVPSLAVLSDHIPVYANCQTV